MRRPQRSAALRSRVQLAKGWAQYESARRDAGNNGQYGLVYGLSLISTEPATSATNGQRLSIRSAADVPKLDLSRCQLILGDALIELRKLRGGSVNAIVCSPPYLGRIRSEPYATDARCGGDGRPHGRHPFQRRVQIECIMRSPGTAPCRLAA